MFKTQLKKSVFMIEIMLRLEFFKHLKGIKMCFTTTKPSVLRMRLGLQLNSSDIIKEPTGV